MNDQIYNSADGVEETNSPSTEENQAWGSPVEKQEGQTQEMPQTEKENSFETPNMYTPGPDETSANDDDTEELDETEEDGDEQLIGSDADADQAGEETPFTSSDSDSLLADDDDDDDEIGTETDETKEDSEGFRPL